MAGRNYKQEILNVSERTAKGRKVTLTMYVYPDGHGYIVPHIPFVGEKRATSYFNQPVDAETIGPFMAEMWDGLR